MNQNWDTSWQRNGTSWIWDNEARNMVCTAEEAWSLRRFMEAAAHDGWPELPPSNKNRTLLIAGLDAALDLMNRNDAEAWLREAFRPALLKYQNEYGDNSALVFWLPTQQHQPPRLKALSNDSVLWICSGSQDQPSKGRADASDAPSASPDIEFGAIMWGRPSDYPQEILLEKDGKPIGLHYRRFS